MKTILLAVLLAVASPALAVNAAHKKPSVTPTAVPTEAPTLTPTPAPLKAEQVRITTNPVATTGCQFVGNVSSTTVLGLQGKTVELKGNLIFGMKDQSVNNASVRERGRRHYEEALKIGQFNPYRKGAIEEAQKEMDTPDVPLFTGEAYSCKN